MFENFLSTLFVGIDVSSKSNIVCALDFNVNKLLSSILNFYLFILLFIVLILKLLIIESPLSIWTNSIFECLHYSRFARFDKIPINLLAWFSVFSFTKTFSLQIPFGQDDASGKKLYGFQHLFEI